MGLSVIVGTHRFQFSKSPMVCRLKTDAYHVSSGTACQLVLKFGSTNAVGGTLTFQWKWGAVVMTVVSGTPDDSGTQLPKKGSMSWTDYATAVATALNTNYLLNNDFTIVPSGDVIILQANNVGMEYDLNVHFTESNVGCTNYSHIDGTSEVYNDNYKMRLDVWMESQKDSNDFRKVGSMELDPIDDECIFDVQEIVNANLDYNLPDYGQVISALCPDVIKRYYVKFLEKYGNPVSNREVHTGDKQYAIKAGVEKEVFQDVTEHLNSLYRLVDPAKFLTKQPRTKLVKEWTQEFLFFAKPGHSDEVTINVTVTMMDATTYSFSPGSMLVEGYDVMCIPTGFTALGLEGLYGTIDGIEKYVVELSWASGKSEDMTYVCDHDIYMDETVLLFTNSVGGMDTKRLTGTKVTGMVIEKDIAEKIALYNTAVDGGEALEVGHLKDRPIKVNTGWITKVESDWLEELFMAEEKWIDVRTDTVEYGHGKWLPIVITSKELPKYNTLTGMAWYEFEYKVAYRNKV